MPISSTGSWLFRVEESNVILLIILHLTERSVSERSEAHVFTERVFANLRKKHKLLSEHSRVLCPHFRFAIETSKSGIRDAANKLNNPPIP